MSSFKLLMNHEAWATRYAQMKKELIEKTGLAEDNGAIFKIEHIGSTSIADLPATGIVDILIDLNPSYPFEMIQKKLIEAGFEYKAEDGIKGREFFTRNDSEPFFRIHMIHMDKNACFLEDHLTIRDYLRSNKGALTEYRECKLKSFELANGTYDTYQDLKKGTLEKLQIEARQWYLTEVGFTPLFKVLSFFDNADFFWSLGSGWALAYSLGKPYRYHHDVDILIWKDEEERVVSFLGFQGFRVDMVVERGRYQRWHLGVTIPANVKQIHARKDDLFIDLLLTERKNGK